jgi:hypothetical protein
MDNPQIVDYKDKLRAFLERIRRGEMLDGYNRHRGAVARDKERRAGHI